MVSYIPCQYYVRYRLIQKLNQWKRRNTRSYLESAQFCLIQESSHGDPTLVDRWLQKRPRSKHRNFLFEIFPWLKQRAGTINAALVLRRHFYGCDSERHSFIVWTNLSGARYSFGEKGCESTRVKRYCVLCSGNYRVLIL